MNILLTGRPGTGKTWVMKQIIEHYELNTKGKVGLIDYLTNKEGSVIATGKYLGETFDGGDKLSMAAISSVRDLILQCDSESFILLDGDRFTNKTMLSYDPIIINITGDGAEGRLLRGSNQTEKRLKSMATRYNNYPYHYRVDNSTECLDLVKEIINGEKFLPTKLQDGRGQESLF